MNATVSSAEIRKATGLSQKTMTRWHKGGHIPEPEVGQHPSGRGKMGYYPKHVLALVRRIVALKKEGQPLKQAASQAGHEFEQRETPGRPSGLDPVTIETICEGVRLGLPNRDAALRAGVSEATFYSWVRQAREPDATDELLQFLESLERSQSDLKAILLARVHKAGTEGHWQAATWMLARKFPKEFGQTVETKVQHSGSIHTGPRKVTVELVRADGSKETIERNGADPAPPDPSENGG